MTQKLFTKNFTLLILGQVSSLFGNIILKFALSMYILDITNSATIFAGMLAISTVPTILLSPLGGILADRANRRNIMIVLDTFTGISVLCTTIFLAQSNSLTLIGLLLIILSILGAFETPTVQACVPQMLTGDNIIKGNAVINQAVAMSSLLAPILGSVLYSAFGIKPVMVTSILCFFTTALLECFIQLEYIPMDKHNSIVATVKHDLVTSLTFMWTEQPSILKMLLLVSTASFFVMGTAIVGLPYIIRNILGLSATYYGIAESIIAIASVLGGILSGLFITKLKIRKLSLILSSLGIFLIPAGMAFLLPTNNMLRYIINLLSFCGVQASATVFSIFAVSIIQQNTPNHLLGKIMAYTSTITMLSQPLGQMAYGFLFDQFHYSVYWVLIPTGMVVTTIGILATGFFKKLEKEQIKAK